MDSERSKMASEHKLLQFRVPPARAGALMGMPHDVHRLRRPVEVVDVVRVRPERQGTLTREARTVVNSLEMFARLLDDPGVLFDAHRHCAQDLAALTGALSLLVDQLARLEGSALSAVGAVPAPTHKAASSAGQQDAGSMVKNCEGLLMAIAGPNVAMSISFERETGRLELSGEELTRILINLVQNSTEAMPGGGRIAITVRRGMGVTHTAIITVQDTGCGIPAHALGQIFQAGYTSKSVKGQWPSSKHYGLGLTVVRDLVEGAGGSIRVSSTLKKGTSLEVKLPCGRDS